MPIISIAIQKGGSGKTTTALNLGAALQRAGKSVLLIDADPQADLSQSLGIDEQMPERGFYSEFKKEISGAQSDLRNAVIKLPTGLSIVPASYELGDIENMLISVYEKEKILGNMIRRIKPDFDFIIIDCPHANGMLTENALTASQYVLIPLPGEFLPLKGVYSFMNQYERIKKNLNKELQVLGLVLTKFERQKIMNVQVREELSREFDGKLCHTVIRTNIQLAKAQEAGKDIFSFDKNSNGAKDYEQLATELLVRLQQ